MLVRTLQEFLSQHARARDPFQQTLPGLPAFLEETFRPRDNDERLTLLGVCEPTNRPCASARLVAEAFAADSRPAENLFAGHRFKAACFATLAGRRRRTGVRTPTWRAYSSQPSWPR